MRFLFVSRKENNEHFQNRKWSCYIETKEFTNLFFHYFKNRIEGEQTFSVIRAGTASQIQVGEIVVGDIIQVTKNYLKN